MKSGRKASGFLDTGKTVLKKTGQVFDDFFSGAKRRKNLTITSRNSETGNPNAIVHFDVDLNKRQSKLLNSLNEYDASVIVNKSDVSLNDLSTLTAKTGDEFAMFTRGSQRLIVRGGVDSVNINLEKAQSLLDAGYRWSGHTHPGTGYNVKLASDGDLLVLKKFGQQRSAIYDSVGHFNVFEGS